MTNIAPQRAALLDTLRRFLFEVENLTIENRVYFDLILERCPLPHDQLRERVTHAQQDRSIRDETHKQYAQMWETIEQAALAAFAEEHLSQTPTPDKPN
ncbi:MAG: hypothetical protein WBQ95_18935 [Terracidiphilus sp.]